MTLWCERCRWLNSVCHNPRTHTVCHKRRLQPTTQAMAELVFGGHRVQPVLSVVPEICTTSCIETHKRPKCPSLDAILLLIRHFSCQFFFVSLLLVPEPPTTDPPTRPTTTTPPPSTYQSTEFTSDTVTTGRRTSI